MGEHVIKLPDVGEGVAEAELVEWHVKVGDLVREDALLAAVMTDKATVEIPSPVDGEVLWLGAEIGETVRGRLADRAPEGRRRGQCRRGDGRSRRPAEGRKRRPRRRRRQPRLPNKPAPRRPSRAEAGARLRRRRPPPVRALCRRAARRGREAAGVAGGAPARREAGVDLRQVAGHGSGGPHHARGPRRLPRARAAAARGQGGLAPNTAVEDIKVVGLRRKIAEKMALAKSRIPHITYVEEVDVTALEELRAALNKDEAGGPARS